MSATLTEEQAALFPAKNFAFVATLQQDGWPHLTPVWIDWDGECVLFITAVDRQKTARFARRLNETNTGTRSHSRQRRMEPYLWWGAVVKAGLCSEVTPRARLLSGRSCVRAGAQPYLGARTAGPATR
jgi:predicted pyridoxine 5'-phosphate oxidase superfamily flavin-nucleotide-binding protein